MRNFKIKDFKQILSKDFCSTDKICYTVCLGFSNLSVLKH